MLGSAGRGSPTNNACTGISPYTFIPSLPVPAHTLLRIVYIWNQLCCRLSITRDWNISFPFKGGNKLIWPVGHQLCLKEPLTAEHLNKDALELLLTTHTPPSRLGHAVEWFLALLHPHFLRGYHPFPPAKMGNCNLPPTNQPCACPCPAHCITCNTALCPSSWEALDTEWSLHPCLSCCTHRELMSLCFFPENRLWKHNPVKVSLSSRNVPTFALLAACLYILPLHKIWNCDCNHWCLSRLCDYTNYLINVFLYITAKQMLHTPASIQQRRGS